MNILGISAFYHDSAACLVRDGDIIAAAQEERFTRRKHYAGFPGKAVCYCLDEAGISGGLKKSALPSMLFTEHHESHAASAFFPSPYDTAAVLCMDGVGEWATTSAWLGQDNHLTPLWDIPFPHSLGLLYSAFTYYTGFKVNSGEYKVMGLAPYGKPKYVRAILDHLLDLKPDGTFRLNMDYFNYCTGLTMTNRKFEALFGGPPRQPETPLTQREMDLARSIQEVIEEAVLRLARTLH